VRPGKIGLIFGLVAVGAIVAGIATAFVISELLSDDDSDEDPGAWRTYDSEFWGFEIAYPADWHLDERGQTTESKEPLIHGGVTISKNEDARTGPKVLAYKNFQGDWCLRGRLVEREIEVSGVAGVETHCLDCEEDAPLETCPADPHTVVRVFGTVGVREYYVVLGEPDDDLESVRRIVESFQFID
jgi:hypothetical protein